MFFNLPNMFHLCPGSNSDAKFTKFRFFLLWPYENHKIYKFSDFSRQPCENCKIYKFNDFSFKPTANFTKFSPFVM